MVGKTVVKMEKRWDLKMVDLDWRRVEKKEMSLVVLMVDYLAKSLGEKTADLLVVTMDR